MELKEMIERAFLKGYVSGSLDVGTVLVCILSTAVIAVYIFMIYKSINRNSFYNKNFSLSLIALAVITSSVILTIQANIVVSLGMVGALSIVRFRTAIKDPMDLVFLFWSISAGIICGAGYAIIAVIASLAVTAALVLFAMMPESRSSLIPVANADSHKREEEIMEIVEKSCRYARTRARNVLKNSLSLTVEVQPRNQKVMMAELMELDGITSASLVEHSGDITL